MGNVEASARPRPATPSTYPEQEEPTEVTEVSAELLSSVGSGHR